MKYILTVIFCLLSLHVFPQLMSYSEWQEQAKSNINMQPEYGNVKKTSEQIEADNSLIKSAIAEEGTARKASEHFVQLGFKYLYSGDIIAAMSRFNQAWLLDKSNENAYWGYGAVYFTFLDAESAIKQYDKGLTINPASSIILTDKATVYYIKYQQEQGQDKMKLTTAINLLNSSYKIDSVNRNTLFKLSVCYFLAEDCVNAKKYYEACAKLAGGQLDPQYAAALSARCGK